MPNVIFSSSRNFRLWEYTIGHSQLLLRSTREKDIPTRVDVLFKVVKSINLPTTLVGLSISEAAEAEIAELSLPPFHSIQKDLKAFIVRSSAFVGHVTASAVFWHEDEGEYSDPSHFQLGPL